MLPLVAAFFALVGAPDVDGGAPAESHTLVIPVSSFKVLEQDSGPVNYYTVLSEGGKSVLHASYKPPLETVVMAAVVPEEARQKASQVSWRWRVHSLPKDSNDCGPGFSDSGAAVFLTFKSGMKYKILKYVWSTTGTAGSFCQSKRGWFLDRDTILLRVGGPLDTWQSESVDPRAAFAKHFETKLEEVPDFVGVAVMTDGDQSNSVVESDYADFVVRW